MSPAGGMGRKSLLTRGSAGGVYFFEGMEAKGFFNSFLGAGSSLKNRITCFTQKIIPTTHSPITPDSSQRRPKAMAKNVIKTNRIPKKG